MKQTIPRFFLVRFERQSRHWPFPIQHLLVIHDRKTSRSCQRLVYGTMEPFWVDYENSRRLVADMEGETVTL